MYGGPSPCVKLRTLTSSILSHARPEMEPCDKRQLPVGLFFPVQGFHLIGGLSERMGTMGFPLSHYLENSQADALLPRGRETIPPHQISSSEIFPGSSVRLLTKVTHVRGCRGGARNLCHLSQRLRESKLWLSHLFVRLIIHHIIGTTFLRWEVDVSAQKVLMCHAHGSSRR
ncbi:hypothetical protein BDV34DRAFT_192920 [Aspergillus parasiticus]|uniref:Uncharacterized protein n=1 Tax=Aspergillus parasiticus TaxID=5067 RepID=A0A5N6DP35_ASPPA|nr:hypothetical protein BDV34DRAFT_192920 [Aspergillus parasiticus]